MGVENRGLGGKEEMDMEGGNGNGRGRWKGKMRWIPHCDF